MDRFIITNGEQINEEDLLKTNKNTYVALARSCAAILGKNTLLNGFACTPSSVPDMHVNVADGEIYQLAATDTTAYGNLPIDSHQILKQGINLDPTQFTFTAPPTIGQSVDYLIEFRFLEADTATENRQFYNAAPQVVPTIRQDSADIKSLQGTPATSGTQVPPAVEPGYVPGWVIRVAYGQTAITSADISVHPNAPFITETLTQKISQAFADARYALKSTTPANKSYFSGYQITNNVSNPNTAIDFRVGECADSTGATLIALNSTLTKSINAAWAAGNNAGGLFSGSVAASTTYHLFVIKKDSDGTIDAGFDTSITAANKPAGYSSYRRVASLYTDVSSHLVQIINFGDDFLLQVPVSNYNANTVGTSAVLVTLSVPSGLKINAKSIIDLATIGNGTRFHLLVTSPDQPDTAPSEGCFTLRGSISTTEVDNTIFNSWKTNTAAQIRFRADESSVNLALIIITHGWIDDRGRLG